MCNFIPDIPKHEDNRDEMKTFVKELLKTKSYSLLNAIIDDVEIYSIDFIDNIYKITYITQNRITFIVEI